MSQIGTLVTGAGVVTVIAGQAQCDQYILIGDADTPPPITGLSVEIDGTPYITISGSQPLIQAFSQWLMETVGASVGYLLTVATGIIKKNTTFRFTNAGATTPAIYAFSEAQNGFPIVATTVSVNASSYQVFEKFSALFLATPANIVSVEMFFKDGAKSTLTAVECGALYGMYHNAAADGYLSACTVIDNTNQSIESVKVNVGAGGCVILAAKMQDEAFAQILKQK